MSSLPARYGRREPSRHVRRGEEHGPSPEIVGGTGPRKWPPFTHFLRPFAQACHFLSRYVRTLRPSFTSVTQFLRLSCYPRPSATGPEWVEKCGPKEMQRLDWSLSRKVTQDIKTQPQINHYQSNRSSLWPGPLAPPFVPCHSALRAVLRTVTRGRGKRVNRGRGSFTQPLVLSSRVFHLLPSPRPPAGMNERRGTRRQGGKRLRQNDPRTQPLPPSFHRCSVPFTHLTPLSLGVNLLGHNGNSQDGRMKVLIYTGLLLLRSLESHASYSRSYRRLSGSSLVPRILPSSFLTNGAEGERE